MDLFRQDNTTGYTQDHLDALNAEWTARAASEGLEEGTPEYKEMAKSFSDEVARR